MQPTLGEWLDDANALVTRLRTALDATVGVRGVAVIPTNMIDRYGLSGPVSRASGVDLDTRRRTAVYDELKWPEVVIEPRGDAYSRLATLCNDAAVSSSLCRQILDRLPSLDGPLETRLPTAIKAPRGRTWTTIEAPLGTCRIPARVPRQHDTVADGLAHPDLRQRSSLGGGASRHSS